MLDLIVRGGQVVTPWGVGSWDVAVQGEQIVAVAEPGTLTRDVGRVIDAAGKIAIPGGIEPHAHASLPLPYPGVRDQGLRAAPPDVISKACVFGGTTTVVVCPPLIRPIGSRRPPEVFVMEPTDAWHRHDPAHARRLHTPRLGCVLGQ